jgi:hypothetical protein
MELVVFKINLIQMCAFLVLNFRNSTVMHGMENVKNLVKSQMEVASVYKTNIKMNYITIRSQDLCVLTDCFKSAFQILAPSQSATVILYDILRASFGSLAIWGHCVFACFSDLAISSFFKLQLKHLNTAYTVFDRSFDIFSNRF